MIYPSYTKTILTKYIMQSNPYFYRSYLTNIYLFLWFRFTPEVCIVPNVQNVPGVTRVPSLPNVPNISVCTTSQSSRQNLDSIVEAIRHLEGDHLFSEDHHQVNCSFKNVVRGNPLLNFINCANHIQQRTTKITIW